MKKEHPILFSSQMVKAILEGRKTITRRVIKPQPILTTARGRQIIGDEFHEWPVGIIRRISLLKHDMILKCPYGQVGDRLWVREALKVITVPEQRFKHINGEDTICDKDIVYSADDNFLEWEFPPDHKLSKRMEKYGYCPSIFMPRWTSRIMLEITNIRVERLQGVTEEDAQKEGWHIKNLNPIETYDPVVMNKAREWFTNLWDSLNGKKYPWKSNPWVWVIEFVRQK